MKKGIYLILYTVVAMLMGCTAGDRKTPERHEQQPTDTIYTEQKAMAVYAYQPERALAIIDSAEVVGNLSQPRADFLRMRIYSQTQKGEVMDSLLGRSRFEATRAIGERLLQNDAVTTDFGMQQNVLEALFCTARQQKDTESGLRWARQLVDVCHRQGAKTEVLRNEAEIGTFLCYMGQKEQGFSKLDSVLALLDGQRRFNELDALIIASKRKMDVLANEGRYLETLPLAQRIIDRLDDYEQHPDIYHDGTYREPQDSADRADYIQFYRSQAQGRMTAAYAVLGQQQSMEEVYQQIERTVRDATAREHLSRYHALEQDTLRREAEGRSQLMTLVAVISISALLIVLAFAGFMMFQRRSIERKNRILVREITEAIEYKKYKRMYEELLSAKEPHAAPRPAAGDGGDISAMTDVELFRHIDSLITGERLFLDPHFDRQTLVDRLQVSKERIGAAIAQGSSHDRLSDYIQKLRLEYSAQLLVGQPELTVKQVAQQSGFSSSPYFCTRFRQYFGVSPSDFRQDSRMNVYPYERANV